MSDINNPYPFKVDLTNCDEEPIHLIPQIQHHACLIAANIVSFDIIHVSKNTASRIGIAHESLIGKNIAEVLDELTFNTIKNTIKEKEDLRLLNPLRVGFEIDQEYFSYNLIIHSYHQKLILEFEKYDDLVSTTKYQHQLSKVISKIQRVKDLSSLFQTSAEEIRNLTGYDRVMVYEFDKEGNGAVIAESKNPELEGFLGLHYPATDIPKQARALFLKNKVRLTSDILSEPVGIHPVLNPEDQQPLDLTYATARGVSPVHLEYLSNMGVRGTMSIAIENNGELWGLFACHHYSPKYVSYNLRSTCEFIGQIFSGHLSLHAVNNFKTSILQVNLTKSKLYEQMSKDWNIIQGLIHQGTTVMDLFDCSGVCIIKEQKVVTLGQVPNEKALLELAHWLDEKGNESHFYTHHLSSVFPEAAEYKNIASGLLSIKIIPESSNYIIWFRPEVIQQVTWGGNPEKAMIKSEDGKRLSPRKSFEKWAQTINSTSLPWQTHEIDVAISLRNDIKDSIFKKFKEVEQFNKELSEAYEELEGFSYSVSHDLRAPLRNINGFAQILLEDYMEGMDEYGKSVVHTIIKSTDNMNSLIDDMLAFSKIGRTGLNINELDLKKTVQNKVDEILNLAEYKNKDFQLIFHPDLPTVYADAAMFGQVIHNLISNAVKYSSKKEKPAIEIGGEAIGEMTRFYVKDNGIGIDSKYQDQIFKVFTRLVAENKFPGNGVGLAIVKRIVDKHDGNIVVESIEGDGATFYIELPILKQDKK